MSSSVFRSLGLFASGCSLSALERWSAVSCCKHTETTRHTGAGRQPAGPHPLEAANRRTCNTLHNEGWCAVSGGESLTRTTAFRSAEDSSNMYVSTACVFSAEHSSAMWPIFLARSPGWLSSSSCRH